MNKDSGKSGHSDTVAEDSHRRPLLRLRAIPGHALTEASTSGVSPMKHAAVESPKTSPQRTHSV